LENESQSMAVYAPRSERRRLRNLDSESESDFDDIGDMEETKGRPIGVGARKSLAKGLHPDQIGIMRVDSNDSQPRLAWADRPRDESEGINLSAVQSPSDSMMSVDNRDLLQAVQPAGKPAKNVSNVSGNSANQVSQSVAKIVMTDSSRPDFGSDSGDMNISKMLVPAAQPMGRPAIDG